MKFGKEFKKQKVPEWIEAYVDYNGLKRVLQDVRRFRQSKQLPSLLRASRQRLALHGAFNGLDAPANAAHSRSDIEDQVIAVNTVHRDNSRKLYNTTFLMSTEGGESESMFFKKLDDELNKVNTFYKDKVEEVNKEAALLNKQMEAMIALRIKVEKRDFDGSQSPRHRVEITGSRLDDTKLSNGKGDEPTPCVAGNEFSTGNSSSACRPEVESRGRKPDPLDVLDCVKINNTLESPISTIKSVLYDSKEKDLSFNKEDLRKVESRLKSVFIEFYRKVRLVKHYSFVNLAAFSKIMKKYEKIALRSAARSYMKIVDDSYIGSSDELMTILMGKRAHPMILLRLTQTLNRKFPTPCLKLQHLLVLALLW